MALLAAHAAIGYYSLQKPTMKNQKPSCKVTNISISRRRFLRHTTAAAFGFWIVPRHVIGRGKIPPSEKLDVAGIGIGGQGGSVLRDPALSSQNIVALCDVDWKFAA